MKISRQPDIEFTREAAEISLDDEETQEIKNRIPFSIGTEFINDEWISSTFEKIADIYRREISEYKGTVKDFLMGKNIFQIADALKLDWNTGSNTYICNNCLL